MSPFQEFIVKVQDAILTPIITLLALGAFVLFVWGVVLFISSSDDEEKRRTGQQHMIWGIIGLVIIFGANGIVALLKATVGG
ncbi:pilin [Patescibacteria group bacterium]|nr:pilin [Patescibacteria group bacterium]MBU2158766.1 pilin [Patescibacteria group bacterium]MBU2220735.1 pilin [Patescibacteria group bacterium]